MTLAHTPGPLHGSLRSIARMLLLPAVAGGLALVIAGSLGHVLIGLLVMAGLLLGAANGVSAQVAGAKLTPEGNITRGVIVHNSLRRLGIITAIALLIAWLARPIGWTVLLGLAVYQLLSLGSAFGAAIREVRRG